MKKFILLFLLTATLSYGQASVDGISHGTFTRHVHWTASNLGKNVTHPPVVDHYGITKVLKFTVNTDKVSYKWLIPDDYASGDLTLHINWTRSTTGTDESTDTVNWQVKNLVVNGTSEEIAAGENTDDTIQDAYTSSSTTDKICYETEDITIAAGEFSAGELLIMEIMAITVGSGTPLSEPAIISVGLHYTAYRVTP